MLHNHVQFVKQDYNVLDIGPCFETLLIFLILEHSGSNTVPDINLQSMMDKNPQILWNRILNSQLISSWELLLLLRVTTSEAPQSNITQTVLKGEIEIMRQIQIQCLWMQINIPLMFGKIKYNLNELAQIYTVGCIIMI